MTTVTSITNEVILYELKSLKEEFQKQRDGFEMLRRAFEGFEKKDMINTEKIKTDLQTLTAPKGQRTRGGKTGKSKPRPPATIDQEFATKRKKELTKDNKENLTKLQIDKRVSDDWDKVSEEIKKKMKEDYDKKKEEYDRKLKEFNATNGQTTTATTTTQTSTTTTEGAKKGKKKKEGEATKKKTKKTPADKEDGPKVSGKEKKKKEGEKKTTPVDNNSDDTSEEAGDTDSSGSSDKDE